MNGRQWAALGAILVAGGVLAFVSFGNMGKNLVYYLSPDELLHKGAAAHGLTVRLGGLVEKKTIVYDPQTLELHFRVGMAADDPQGIAVQATGAPPQMFQEGIGAVVEGQYDGQTFHADRVMVKHSNEYRPPAAGERPADVYKKTLVN